VYIKGPIKAQHRVNYIPFFYCGTKEAYVLSRFYTNVINWNLSDNVANSLSSTSFYLPVACKTPSVRGGGWGRFKYSEGKRYNDDLVTAVRLDNLLGLV